MSRNASSSRHASVLLMILAGIAAATTTAADVTPSGDANRTAGEARCHVNKSTEAWQDCACFGRFYAEQRRATPGISDYDLALKAAIACPAKDPKPIMDEVFETCDSYQKGIRSDHAAFCQCTAKHVADAFLAKPDLAARQQLQRQAMQDCGIANRTTRIDDKTPAPTVTPTATPVMTDTSCVKLSYNANGIAGAAKMGRYTGDVIVSNDCSQQIALVQAIDLGVSLPGVKERCTHVTMPPHDRRPVRSLSKEAMPGLARQSSHVAPKVCLGRASDVKDSDGFASDCACAEGVKTIPVPDGETLR